MVGEGLCLEAMERVRTDRVPAAAGAEVAVVREGEAAGRADSRQDLAATRTRLGGRRLLLYDNYPVNGDFHGTALGLVLALPATSAAGGDQDKPNILFMHVDQMHWQAMSAYGNKYVKTPNLDRIAADGCSFRTSYAAMPQCCPARANWYTGRASSEHGVPTNEQKILPNIPDLG
mgnify:CR=1 FL=1